MIAELLLAWAVKNMVDSGSPKHQKKSSDSRREIRKRQETYQTNFRKQKRNAARDMHKTV